MRFSTIVMSVIVAVSTTLAMPATPIEQRQTVVLCPGTDSNPVCCATDVLGVADLKLNDSTLHSDLHGRLYQHLRRRGPAG